ncbi:MAG: P-II family nitrogen regulator [Clostridiales bacterium]|jgi:nitrogen regulatory protein PII|nr:P-II family nitrogen regulator [Clostridiales bacterium]
MEASSQNTGGKETKALFIIVNAGFSTEAVEITRRCGAKGATIINARGSAGADYKFSGINYEPEKEIILSLVEDDIAQKIMDAIRDDAGISTPSHGICFCMPVERMTLLNKDNSAKF